jgi:hypothetical protein
MLSETEHRAKIGNFSRRVRESVPLAVREQLDDNSG